MKAEDLINPSDKQLRLAIENENDKFHACYTWLEKAMPANFFEQVKYENIILTTRNLIGLDLQGFFCIINIKRMAIVLCLDSADADLHILKKFCQLWHSRLSMLHLIIPSSISKLQKQLADRHCKVH